MTLIAQEKKVQVEQWFAHSEQMLNELSIFESILNPVKLVDDEEKGDEV